MGPIGMHGVAAGWMAWEPRGPQNHPDATRGLRIPAAEPSEDRPDGEERNMLYAIPRSGHRRHSRPIHCCCTTTKAYCPLSPARRSSSP